MQNADDTQHAILIIPHQHTLANARDRLKFQRCMRPPSMYEYMYVCVYICMLMSACLLLQMCATQSGLEN